MNILNLLKLNIISLIKKSQSKPKVETVPSVSQEVKEALAMADAARKEVEEAKKIAEAAKLDAQIEGLKARLPSPILDSKECLERFGSFKINGTQVTWADEAKHCSTLMIPQDIAEGWINTATNKPTTRIYCNRYIHIPLILALLNLKKNGILSELKTFDGCFMIRKQRGGEALSYHSWAVAIDVNAKENPLGAEPKLSKTFVECWKQAGWTWGGDWKRKDGQHFQYVLRG